MRHRRWVDARVARVGPVDPTAPTVGGRLVADVVPSPRSSPADPDPLTPYNTVTDIRCTRAGCRREVRDITLFEALSARPCPLCARCRQCRWLCAEGLVDHGLDDTW